MSRTDDPDNPTQGHPGPDPERAALNAERAARRAERDARRAAAADEGAPSRGAAEREARRIAREAERAARKAERTGQNAERQQSSAERDRRKAEQAARKAAQAAGKGQQTAGKGKQPARNAGSSATAGGGAKKRQGGKSADARAARADAPGAPTPRADTPRPDRPRADARRADPPPATAARRSDEVPGRDLGRSGKDASSDPAARTGHDHPAVGRPLAPFDILIVAQGGGIDRQAAILAASLRRNAPGFAGRLIVAEPQPGGAWSGTDPRMSPAARAALDSFGAEIMPLECRDFGASYPHGNKIEALSLLQPGRPFLFLDSDTLILGDVGRMPFDFARPTASMRRTGSWPQPPAYRHTYDSIWRSLYDRFGLAMDTSLDLGQPAEHWERFLYFNAGWFTGADGAEFGRRFRDWAVAVRDDPGEALACQSLDPWLDQVVLPLVIHSLGGGRPGPELDGMDGAVTQHYRNLPLLYATGTDEAVAEYEAIAALPVIAPLLDGWDSADRLIGDRIGRRRIRPMFAGETPPPSPQAVRHRLRNAELWLP